MSFISILKCGALFLVTMSCGKRGTDISFGSPFPEISNGELPNNNGAIALMNASEFGHDKEKGVDADTVTKNDYTALRVALKNGHYKEFKALLIEGANANKAILNDGTTALILAAKKGDKDAVKLLLEKFADVNKANKHGETALMFAAQDGHTDIVKLLLDGGAMVDKAIHNGWTALMLAAQNGHKEIVELLLEKVADVNKANKNGDTALMFAAQNGHKEIVELLLEKVADVNKANKDGWTALMLAAHNGNKDIVKLLLEARADVNQANEFGWTALMLAEEKGHTDIVELLLDGGATVDKVNNDGWTLLMNAAEKGNKDIVKLLLKKDANVNLAYKDGWTALMIAAEKGHTDIVKLLLLKKGANVNLAHKDGWTALMFAAQYGHKDIVKLLLKRGAKVNQANKDGNTAIMLAGNNGHNEVFRTMLNFIIYHGSNSERIYLVKKYIHVINKKSLNSLINNMKDQKKRDEALGYIVRSLSEENLIESFLEKNILLEWAITHKNTPLVEKIIDRKEGWVNDLLAIPLDPPLQDEVMTNFLSKDDNRFFHECDKQEIFKLIFGNEKQYPQTTASIMKHHFDWYISEIQKSTIMEEKQKYQELFNAAAVAAAVGVGGVGLSVFYWLQNRLLEDRNSKLENEKGKQQSQIANQESRIGELEAEKSVNQSQICDLECEITKHKLNQAAEQKALISKVESLDTENKNKIKKIKKLEESIKMHEGIQANARVEDTTEHENLRAEITFLEVEVSKKDNQIKELEKQLNNLGTDLEQQMRSNEFLKNLVEKNENEKDAELKKLTQQLVKSETQIANLNQNITEQDALLIKYDVHIKEQLANDLTKALEIERELSYQPEITRLDFAVGDDVLTRYLEVKHRNISTKEKRQQLLNDCNRQYCAVPQSVGKQWGVFCIGTSDYADSLNSLEEECKNNGYEFIDLTKKESGEVVSLIKNSYENKPFFFINKNDVCKKSMRYSGNFSKMKYEELINHIETHIGTDNQSSGIHDRIKSFYESSTIDQVQKGKLAGLLGEFWAANFFTHLTKSVEDFSIKNTEIPIVASPASSD